MADPGARQNSCVAIDTDLLSKIVTGEIDTFESILLDTFIHLVSIHEVTPRIEVCASLHPYALHQPPRVQRLYIKNLEGAL